MGGIAEQQKQLAEKCAKFLGLKKYRPIHMSKDAWKYGSHDLYPSDFFDEGFGPNLLHLGKREMEKRGFNVEHNKYVSQGYQYWIHREEEMPTGEGDSHDKAIMEWMERSKPKWQKENNDFYAFWLAVEQTGEMEE